MGVSLVGLIANLSSIYSIWCVMDDVSHTSIFHAQLLSFGRQYECSVGVGSGLIVVPITGSEVTFDH